MTERRTRSQDSGSGIERGGYQPLQEGYTPGNQRGYVPVSGTGSLPKAPTGGTGESRPSSNGTSPDDPHTSS